MRFDLFQKAALGLSLSLCLSQIVQGQSDLAATPQSASAFAHTIPQNSGASAVWNSLQKLKTRASLILVVAHPDDEDGGMLAYVSRKEGADTTLLTLNRGEGGQNDMSANYWDELGLLRTQELLAADRYYGVHQYWTRVADFGFSKTLDEALQQWGYDRVLYDVVRVIRMTRPLVVTSVFVGNVSDGHGQHQVAGMMAQEAFKAAGDPKIFPDQIKAGLLPWSPLKVYARVPQARITSKGIYDYATDHWAPVRFRNYVDGTSIDGLPSTTLKIPEGQENSLYGVSYFQLAREGLDNQKSQNGGIAIPPPNPVFSPYHRFGSHIPADAQESTFFDGIDISLTGIADYAPDSMRKPWHDKLAALSATVDQAVSSFSAEDPAKIAPLLADGLKQTNALLEDLNKSSLPAEARYNMAHELKVKQQQFSDALTQALGVSILATALSADASHVSGPLGGPGESMSSFQVAIPGQQFTVSVHAADVGSEAVNVTNLTVDPSGDGDWMVHSAKPTTGALAAGDALTVPLTVTVPAHPTYTRPYFSRPTVEQPYYDINEPQYLNLPTAPYPLTADLTFQYHDLTLHALGVVQTTERVTGPGPLLYPLLTGPPISLWVSPSAGIIPLSGKSLHLQVTLHSFVKGKASGHIHLDLPAGWSSTPAVADFSTEQDGDEQNVNFVVHPQGIKAQSYTISAVGEYQGQNYTDGVRMVGYTGLRPYPEYRKAAYKTSGVDVTIPAGLNVAYIMGTGDDVPSSLEDLGVHVNFLSAQDIETGQLSGYDAIIVGIRAYATRPEIRSFNNRLLDYVKNGGVLLVQYQTPEFDHNYGPYPLSLDNNPEKVVDENSAVDFLAPDNPVFNWPNKITPKDFTGWIEERGHDFVHTWSPEYTALTEMHDPDQDPQKGGLLYAHYGSGIYVYCAFALYRQLPEGVPGAFRIFANLLSLKKNTALMSQK